MIDNIYSDAGILVIDTDAAAVRPLLHTLQEAGYSSVRACIDVSMLGASLDEKALDLIVLAVGEGERDSLALLRDLSGQLPSDDFLPVVAIGTASDAGSRAEAIEAGAKEYMGKPLDAQEFLASVNSLLETRFMSRRLREAKEVLEELLRLRTRESQESHMELLERLARVAGLRDDPSGGHPGRVGRLSGLIAQELLLPAEETRRIMRAAPLHDLGNVGIPDEVARLEGSLTEEQRQRMREHTSVGAYLLHGAGSEVLKAAEQIALNHHERWDGLGYPRGLSRLEIPLAARIVAVADAFDTMTHPRIYREPCSISAALDEIRQESGWQFDPEVVAALVRVHERQPSMLTVTPRAHRSEATC